MRANHRSDWIRGLVFAALFLSLISPVFGQTQINLATQGRNVDFTGQPFTRPVKSGTSLPGSCTSSDLFLNLAATPGQNLYACIAGAWMSMSSSQTGLADPGTNGIVKRTGVNTTVAVAAPTGAIVGTTDTQTLTGKSIDASEINSGVLAAARMPALSGDVASPSGSTATSLATVLQSPGTYGDATHSLQVTVDSKGRVTSLSALPIASSPATSYYQQLSKAGTSYTQRAALNLSSAFSLADNSGAGRTDLDLATVNSNPGTFGSSSQTPVLTVNAYGQITSVTTVASAGGASTNNVTSLTSGTLGGMPSNCSTGTLYFATDQPSGQQIYVCSSPNSWGQFMSLGGSGALSFVNGALDVVTSVVPRLGSTNSFTGSNSFANGITLNSTSSQPACSSSVRGLFWFQNNGSAKDSLQVCAYTGSTYTWANLY